MPQITTVFLWVSLAIISPSLAWRLPAQIPGLGSTRHAASSIACPVVKNRIFADRLHSLRGSQGGRCVGASLRMSSEATMPKNRVLVTGIGAVSPIGIGAPAFFENLYAGKCGISKLVSTADSNDILRSRR